jgi:dTDP-4-dehydrorhamnose reductase
VYLIVGGSGFLGRYIIKNVLERTDDAVIATYATGYPGPICPRLNWRRLDVRDDNALRKLAADMPQDAKVIYLSAFHHPDKVEEQPTLAWDVNIVALANAINILPFSCLYYASTDSVYGEGNKNHAFVEEAPYAPINMYGRHKALAEQIVLAKQGNIVRFPFIIGPSLVEGRPHFYDKIVDDLSLGRPIKMFDDSWRSPLSFDQCAAFLVRLIVRFGANTVRIINIGSDIPLTKYDIGLLVARKIGADPGLVRPVSFTSMQEKFTARRASSAHLDNTLLKQLFELDAIRLEL